MSDFIIKTHKLNSVYAQPHLFILNKGLNSGKPSKEPFTNSFVVIFEKEEDCENLYFIALSLWKSNFWIPFLIGSVIPFLRITDFKKEFSSKSNLMMEEFEQYQKNMAALKLLEQQENQFKKNINLINDLRKTIMYNFCSK